MKYRILDSWEEDKNYFVKIQTPIGVFEGKSTLHPEDEQYKSRFIGYEIAELKAYVKALKKRAKQLEREQGKPAALNTIMEIGVCELNIENKAHYSDIRKILDKNIKNNE